MHKGLFPLADVYFVESNNFCALRMLFLKKGGNSVWRYLLLKQACFKSWNLLVVAGWYHTLVTSLSPVSSLQNRGTVVESWNESRIYFSWVIFYFVLQERTVYAQYSVFNSTECCIFGVGVREVIEAQLHQENIFMLSLILPAYMVLLKRVL